MWKPVGSQGCSLSALGFKSAAGSSPGELAQEWLDLCIFNGCKCQPYHQGRHMVPTSESWIPFHNEFKSPAAI